MHACPMDCGNIRTSGKGKFHGWGLLPWPVLQTGNDGSRQEVEDGKVGRKELRVLREVVSIYFPSTPILRSRPVSPRPGSV